MMAPTPSIAPTENSLEKKVRRLPRLRGGLPAAIAAATRGERPRGARGALVLLTLPLRTAVSSAVVSKVGAIADGAAAARLRSSRRDIGAESATGPLAGAGTVTAVEAFIATGDSTSAVVSFTRGFERSASSVPRFQLKLPTC